MTRRSMSRRSVHASENHSKYAARFSAHTSSRPGDKPTAPPRVKEAGGWDPVARWYAQWVGKNGSAYHRNLAIPTLLELLQPRPREVIADIGCGTGVLAAWLSRSVEYIGIDASRRLLSTARRRFGNRDRTRFVLGDATRLPENPELHARLADAAVFLLSIQDMAPLPDILVGTAWLLKPRARIVVVMFHPCFRVPRQSGWGWDDDRRLQYRRIDSYLSPQTVPVRPVARGRPGSVTAHHLPMEAYVNGLVDIGFRIERLVEVPAYPGIVRKGHRSQAENRANREIPLLLGLRAVRE